MFGLLSATAVVIYATTSYILLRKPTLLHKKKQLKFKCMHISHRGVSGAGENIENTMTAFRHAVDECGTDMLEMDCQITSDGHVVVSHDDYLLRACGVEDRISNMPYHALPQYLNTLPLDFNKNISCVSESSDRRIPLLSEVFSAFPHLPINIDIKRNDPQLLKKVGRLIEEFEREHITPWGNFDDQVVKQCYAGNPTIPVYFSLRRVALLCLWYYTGLLPFIPLKESCLEIVMPSVFINKPDLLHNRTGRTRFVLSMVDKLLMRRKLFAHLQQRGIQVYAWVLNDEEEYERAFKLGIDGIMTDFPSKLRQYIDSGFK